MGLILIIPILAIFVGAGFAWAPAGAPPAPGAALAAGTALGGEARSSASTEGAG